MKTTDIYIIHSLIRGATPIIEGATNSYEQAVRRAKYVFKKRKKQYHLVRVDIVKMALGNFHIPRKIIGWIHRDPKTFHTIERL